MVKFIKSLSVVFCLISVAVFSVIIYGTRSIPDEIVLVSDKAVSSSNLFTFEKTGENYRANSPESVDGGGYRVNVSLLNIIPVKTSTVHISRRHYVVPGGEIFGLKMYSKGVMVVATGAVETAGGSQNPALQAGLEAGDIIVSINGETVNESTRVSQLFRESNGEPMNVTVAKNGKIYETVFSPALSSTEGIYKAGLWIRDSAAGIGTITYYDENAGVYGSLGHAVCDVDTNSIIPILSGEAVKARITGCYKGVNGRAGELCGVFSGGTLGSILINGETGVYGFMKRVSIPDKDILPVATKSEVALGKAQIISTVDSEKPEYYNIEITKIFKNGDSVRNMCIKVTDPVLTEKTGGIVQGMSGSPIIQNGMLVGAVTHVFINDSLRGYAIFAENMLDTSDTLYEYALEEAS